MDLLYMGQAASQLARRGDRPGLARLVEAGFSPNERDSKGRTLAWYAARDHDRVRVDLLLGLGARPIDVVSGYLASITSGELGLFLPNFDMWLAESDKAAVHALADQALEKGIENKCIELVRWAVANGSDPNDFGSDPNIPIAWAIARSFSPAIAQELIQFGWRVGEAPGGQTICQQAVRRGSIECLEWLSAHAPELMSIPNLNGTPPIHQAILAKKEQVALALLRFGANPDAKDRRGRRPLHLACAQGLWELAGALIERGSDPFERSGLNGAGKSAAKLIEAATNPAGRGKIKPYMEEAELLRMLPINPKSKSGMSL